MRIAHVIHRYPPARGGAEAVFARLSRWLAAQGDDVHVFTSNALDLEAFWDRRGARLPCGTEVQDGVHVHRYSLFHLPLLHRYVFKALSLVPLPRWQALTVPFSPILPGLWRTTGDRSHAFDVVHATAFPYSFPLACARRLARTSGARFFLTPFVHTGNPDEPHDRTRRGYTSRALLNLARSADHLFVQTDVERNVLLECGIAAERMTLQGLGVDLGECTGGSRSAARRAWDLPESAVVVGHLANNSVEKGSVDLLRAAALAWSGGATFAVVLAGPEMPNFRVFRQAFGHSASVRYLGPLDDPQKRDFFAAIDLFALPSRSDSFGLVLPEAWANGAPCVAYRAGGVPGVIRDGEDGVLVRCGDVGALAQTLRRLSEDAALRRQMGHAGRQRIERGEFEWEAKLRLVRAAYAVTRSPGREP